MHRSSPLAAALSAVIALALIGCSPSADVDAQHPTASVPPEPAAPEETATPAVAVGLEDVDFGNLEWVYRPGGSVPETEQVTLVDGAAEVDLRRFELGDVVHADVNGDGLADAAAALGVTDGQGYEEHWYLWIATEGEPSQITLPIARTARCGTVTHSVVAEAGGGITVHESRRAIGEDALACSEMGSDERVRTVMAVEARNDGEWWPHQVAPVAGFGGLCPMPAEYEGFPHAGAVHAAPDAASPEVAQGETVYVHALEAWPVYGEDFGGWALVGTKMGDQLACAWAQVD